MFRKLAACSSVAGLAMLGVLAGATPAAAVGAGLYCFAHPSGEPYWGYTEVQVNYNNTNWVAVEAGETHPYDGCFSFAIKPEVALAVHLKGVAYGVYPNGTTWYGETYVYPPGDETLIMGDFQVNCIAGC